MSFDFLFFLCIRINCVFIDLSQIPVSITHFKIEPANTVEREITYTEFAQSTSIFQLSENFFYLNIGCGVNQA